MRKIIDLFVAVIVCFGGPGIVAACGCGSSTGFSIGVDPNDAYVTAVATSYATPTCAVGVQVYVTAPDGTTVWGADSEGGAGSGGPVTATAQYTIGTQGGTYSGLAHYDWDNGNGSGSWPDETGVVGVPTVAEIIQTSGLSDIVTSVQQNSDGSVGLLVQQSDYIQLSADAQEYFQSTCGCPDVAGVLTAIRNAQLQTVTDILVGTLELLQKLGIIHATRTPITGAPNSVQSFPKGPNGKTVRVYGSDGRAVRDIDYGTEAHSGNDPEVHDWTYDSSGKPTRSEPGRAPQPGDIPPGISPNPGTIP